MKRTLGILACVLVTLASVAPLAAADSIGVRALPDVSTGLPTPGSATNSSFAASTRQSTSVHANSSLASLESPFQPGMPGWPQAAFAHGESAMPASAHKGVAVAAIGAVVGVGLLVVFWNAVQTALGGLLMPFFSRIDGHRILDNEVRNRVHEAILQNPGVTIKEITQVVGIGWGTAVYHLKRLETERLIVSERNRQYRRYYKNGGGIVNDAKGAFAELKHPTTQRLAAELVQHPGTGQKELCQIVGISAPLAHKYLARMEEAALLTKQREWKAVKYFPTERLSVLFGQQCPAGVAVVAA